MKTRTQQYRLRSEGRGLRLDPSSKKDLWRSLSDRCGDSSSERRQSYPAYLASHPPGAGNHQRRLLRSGNPGRRCPQRDYFPQVYEPTRSFTEHEIIE